MSDNPKSGRSAHVARLKDVDLDQMSVQELTALIEEATAKRQEKQAEAKAAMLARWKAEAAEAGLSIEAVFPVSPAPQRRQARKDAGGALPVKYRGPNGEEWSGRGRTPKWLQILEAEGRKREEFLVSQT